MGGDTVGFLKPKTATGCHWTGTVDGYTIWRILAGETCPRNIVQNQFCSRTWDSVMEEVVQFPLANVN